MIDISIIMPLYNAEKYLQECLDTVLAQSFDNFELICVDDASSDNTQNILTRYSRNDSRIKIICNSERLGAAMSRNKAMKEAEGKYLTFLDGDDIFHEDMLQVAYETAVNNWADIVEYQYKLVSSDVIYEKSIINHSTEYRNRFSKEGYKISDLKPYEFMNFHSAPWNKLYRKEFILKHNLEFQNLTSSNDVYFVNMALLLADKVIITNDDRVMVYVRQHDTISRISSNRNPMNAYLADKKIAESLIEKGKMPEVYEQFFYRVYCHLVETLKNIKSQESAKKFYEFLQIEGINNICIAGGEFYQCLNQDTKNRFQKFETKSFETEWYKQEGEFLLYLQENAQRIKQLFHKWEKEHMKVGLWGVGRNGKIFLDFCEKEDIHIDIVMDSDEKKWGEVISNFSEVINPQQGMPKIQKLLLTSSNLVEEISHIIKKEKYNVEICDINMYLGR